MAGAGRRSHYRKHLTDSVLNDLPEPDITKGERIAKVLATKGGNIFEVIVAAPLYRNHSRSHDKEHIGKAASILSRSDDPQKGDKDPERRATATLTTAIGPKTQLAILPAKFHKLVWIKRNDLVIVQTGGEDLSAQDEKGGIRHIISYILYKDQIKHLKTENLWPVDDEEFATQLEGITDPTIDEDLRSRAIALIEKEKKVRCVAAEEEQNIMSWDKGENEKEERYGTHEDGIVYNTEGDHDNYFTNTNRIAGMTIEDSESESDEE